MIQSRLAERTWPKSTNGRKHSLCRVALGRVLERAGRATLAACGRPALHEPGDTQLGPQDAVVLGLFAGASCR